MTMRVVVVLLTLFTIPLMAFAETTAAQLSQGTNSSPTPMTAPSQSDPKATTAPLLPQTKSLDTTLYSSLVVDPNEPYVKPDWSSLLRTLVRANAFDVLNDDVVLDEYAAATECELYQMFYPNDFRWKQVRETIRQSVRLKKDTYPLRYHYDTQVQLDRYEFNTQTYRFRMKSMIERANSFRLVDISGQPCGREKSLALPFGFRGVINDPVTMTGIPLDAKDAETLLQYMNTHDNSDHILYLSFDLTVKYVMPIRKELADLTTGAAVYRQPKGDKNTVRLDMVLDRVRFFADPEHTVLIYTLKP